MGILYAILVLSFLIAFHEFGHFIFAKYFGVGVRVFSIGFGPKLLSKKIGETEYALSLLPLGGYVAMMGEDENESELALHPEKSFRSKHALKRILIVLAGPIFNLVLGFVLITSSYFIDGVPVITTKIGQVAKESPAEKAGILQGDKIIAANGVPVKNWQELVKFITDTNNQEIRLTIERGGKVLNVMVSPNLINDKNIFGESVQRRIIGIGPAGMVMEHDAQKSFVAGKDQTQEASFLTILSIWKMITGKVSADNVGGPIMIVQIIGMAADSGLGSVLLFAGLLSVNLFVLNLLPIPALDGGHLPFLFVEWIRGKPVNKKTRAISQGIGIALLVTLMLFAFYNDISRFFK